MAAEASGTTTTLIPSQGVIAGLHVHVPSFGDQNAGDACSSSSTTSTVIAYLGIPFAQPPVGARRWKRPQGPPPAWPRGTVRPSRWRSDPYQTLDLARLATRLRCDNERQALDARFDEDLVSEDCLYLNIWVPESRQKGLRRSEELPVLAWVYGGGFTYGATSQPQYDGARLASRTGCIVVSIAYRVGVFGFLGARCLANEEGHHGAGTGNYGLWDVAEGLQWIQTSIAAFGGDATNVTAFGESAGAIALHYLMLSPSVPKGLFARVALLSGTVLSVLPRSLPSSQATFDALAAELGTPVDASDAEKLHALRTAPAHDVQQAFVCLPAFRPRSEFMVNETSNRPTDRMERDQNTLTFDPSSLCGPTWDGVMVDESFVECAVKGAPIDGVLRNGEKGILFGHTADEGTVFVTGIDSQVGLKRSLAKYPPKLRAEVESLYGTRHIQTDGAAKSISAALMGDYVFVAPVNALTNTLSRQSAIPAYRYTWCHRPSKRMRDTNAPSAMMNDFLRGVGAYHSSELTFLFGWDASEAYTLARDSYPSSLTFHRKPLPAHDDGAEATGPAFTDEERKLSQRFAHHLGLFAHGQAPWASMSGSAPTSLPNDVVPDVPLMLYDEMPSLGASSTEAMQKHSRWLDEAAANDAIVVRQATLYETLAWKDPVDPDATRDVGSSSEKYSFWTSDRLQRMLTYYYGDPRIGFLP